jgi:hypothetical protein
MFRPVTITHPVVVNDGKPFEAIDLNSEAFDTILSDDHYFMYFLNEKIGVVDTYYDASVAYRNIIWQLSQALNQPIKVTQAVLEAMDRNRGGKYLHVQESMHGIQTTELFCLESMVETYAFRPLLNCSQITLKIGDYIQADCPLALQVLLGFTTEGVLKDA